MAVMEWSWMDDVPSCRETGANGVWRVPTPAGPAGAPKGVGPGGAPKRDVGAATGGEALPKYPPPRGAGAGEGEPNNPPEVPDVPLPNPVLPKGVVAAGCGAAEVAAPPKNPVAGAGACAPKSDGPALGAAPNADGAPNAVVVAPAVAAPPNRPEEDGADDPNADGAGAPNELPKAPVPAVPAPPNAPPPVVPAVPKAPPPGAPVPLPKGVDAAPNPVAGAAAGGIPNMEVPNGVLPGACCCCCCCPKPPPNGVLGGPPNISRPASKACFGCTNSTMRR
jgi:hypothetical protein